MSTNTDLLTLAQWLSPAFPVGAFAYSHGIETAIRDGAVTDVISLELWLSDVLAQGSGRADAVLLAAAHRGEAVNDLARAFAASAERLRESERQGAAFAGTVRAVWGLDLPDLLHPVAVGRASALKGLDAETTAALYLQSFASNLVSAAVRLVPLGQTDGQRVLAALSPLCEAVAAEAMTADPEDLWSNAWGSDIAAMRHETMEPRLFQS
jgi:urease accessory protein